MPAPILPASGWRTSLRALLAVAAGCALACESPTGPDQDSHVLTVGAAAEAQVTTGDSLVYTFDAKAGQQFFILVEAKAGAIALDILDPTGVYVGSSFDSGPIPAGASARWDVVDAVTSGTYQVRVHPRPVSSAGGAFVLRTMLVNPLPEHLSAEMRLNDTLSAESIDGPADVDELTFDGLAGQEVNLFLQKLGAGTGALTATLMAPPSNGSSGFTVTSVAATGADMDLELGASGRITLSATGRYRLRIRSVNTQGAYLGAYRFQLYGVNRAPEGSAVALTAGDTLVTERIDHLGDVDELTLTGTPGAAYNLFADVGSADLQNILVEVVSYGGLSVLFGDRLLDSPTGTFVMPATGRATVRVSAAQSRGGLFRGPYRLFLYEIDPRPEGRAADMVPSSAPIQGVIDQYGDLDEYRFTVSGSPRQVGLIADALTSPRSVFAVELVDAATGQSQGIQDAVVDHADWGYVYDATVLKPGSYILRVSSPGGGIRGRYRGPYRFALALVDTLTEMAAPLLSAGDTMRTETAAWPRDEDHFRFSSSTTDTVVAVLMRLAGDTTWKHRLRVYAAPSGQPLDVSPSWEGSEQATPRLDLSPGAGFSLAVDTYARRWTPGVDGEYEIVMKRVSAAPEHNAPTIVLGDTIRDSLDYAGDIDNYVVRGAPGQKVNVSGGWSVQSIPPPFVLSLIDPATGTTLADRRTLGPQYSETATIPAGGELRVRACVGESCEPILHPLLSYWLVVNALSNAPESRPAAFAVGDTVSGETIAQPGDIDEFTFDGISGQALIVYLDYVTGLPVSVTSTGLLLELIDTGTGTVLGTVPGEHSSTRLEDIAMAPVTLPHTGTYTVRVSSRLDPAHPELRNYGPYRFRVTPAP
jgi:hypothetical protein